MCIYVWIRGGERQRNEWVCFGGGKAIFHFEGVTRALIELGKDLL